MKRGPGRRLFPLEQRSRQARAGGLEAAASAARLRPEGLIRSEHGADYTDAELEFLRAVQAWQSRTGIRFPAATHYLRILTDLGYRKIGP